MLTGGSELLFNPSVLEFHNYVINKYIVPQNKTIALFIPCTAKKPYSCSKTHRKITGTIQSCHEIDHTTIHELIVSEPLGIVPRDLESKYPAAHYDMVLDSWFPLKQIPEIRKNNNKEILKEKTEKRLNCLDKRELVRILSERVAKYLSKTQHKYDYHLAYLRSSQKEILMNASEISGVEIKFILKNDYVKSLCSTKGNFYWIMNGLRCQESLSELKKMITFVGQNHQRV